MKVTRTARIMDGVTPDTIPDEVFVSREPIVLKGLVGKWPLCEKSKHSPEKAVQYLKSFYSGKQAPVYLGEPDIQGRFAYNEDVTGLNFEVRKRPLDEVLDEILEFQHLSAPPSRYIASNIVDIFFPGLRAENDLQFEGDCFDRSPMQQGDPLAGIWIGNATVAPCHYDAQANIACCVAGRRKFTVFPPEQIHNLYPGRIDLNPGGPAITMVDFDSPDLERFPRFAEAVSHGFVMNLEPGDAVFIPCMWWHQVEAFDIFNILVNYWWNSYPKVRGQAINALNAAILSIRDRPEEEKKAWRSIFEYYVFGNSALAGEHLPEQSRGPLGVIDETMARQLRAQLINKLNR